MIEGQRLGNEFRIIPMMGRVHHVLSVLIESAKQSGKDVLMLNEQGRPQTPENLNRRFRNMLNFAEREGKIKDTKKFHIHNLRATFISHLVMAGEDPVKIMAIVGHRDWKTMQRYLGFSPNYFADIKKLPYQ